MSVISSLVLAGSSALFVWGLVHHRSEKFFTDFFSEIEKCQEFDFDYVQKLEDLPTGKLISICAQADNDDASLKPSVFDPKKSVVFSSIVPNDQPDHLWRVQDQILQFRVRNMLGATITIKKKEEDLFLFNLKKIGTIEQNDPRCQKVKIGLKQRVRGLMGNKIQFSEYGILPETHVVFIGTLKKDIKGNYSMIPKVVTGENRSLFLKGLDEHIVGINKKGKRIFYAFFGVILAETVRKMVWRIGMSKKKIKQ